MKREVLSHLTVVDASNSVAGQYCGKLLSDWGAETILSEPPGGTPIRHTGPFSVIDGESLLHRHLNVGKRPIVSVEGNSLPALCRNADIALLDVGADHAALREDNQKLVTCTISDFGEDGPRRHWKGGEMIHQALSGVMYRNGDPSREPLYGCGWRVHYVTGAAALSAVLAAIIARARTGRGQHCAIDVAECAASMSYAQATQYDYHGILEKRSAPSNLPSATLKCADAWVTVFIYDYRWPDACDALGLPELIDDPRFDTAENRMANWPAAVAILEAGVARLPADEVVDRLQKLKCVAGKAVYPSQLINSEHLKSRAYWACVETPSGPQPALGPAFRMEKTQGRLSEGLYAQAMERAR